MLWSGCCSSTTATARRRSQGASFKSCRGAFSSNEYRDTAKDFYLTLPWLVLGRPAEREESSTDHWPRGGVSPEVQAPAVLVPPGNADGGPLLGFRGWTGRAKRMKPVVTADQDSIERERWPRRQERDDRRSAPPLREDCAGRTAFLHGRRPRPRGICSSRRGEDNARAAIGAVPFRTFLRAAPIATRPRPSGRRPLLGWRTRRHHDDDAAYIAGRFEHELLPSPS